MEVSGGSVNTEIHADLYLRPLCTFYIGPQEIKKSCKLKSIMVVISGADLFAHLQKSKLHIIIYLLYPSCKNIIIICNVFVLPSCSSGDL